MKAIIIKVLMINFFCIGSVITTKAQENITDFDGNVYKIVKIGEQVWMAENLKATHFSNGDVITKVTTENQWNRTTIAAYCIYTNEEFNASTYGLLYNWAAVADTKNICPNGFHVPSINEWQVLIEYLGGGLTAGGKMKQTGSSLWTSPNNDATNESGLSVVPGGFRNSYGGYNLIHDFSMLWTSSEINKKNAYEYYIHYNMGMIVKEKGSKLQGNSVRCIKN